MNFVINSRRAAIGNLPIHYWRLSTLLKRFGIPKERDWTGHWSIFGRDTRRSLWDLWDAVVTRWKHLRRVLHPDVSHRHYGEFATMSRMFDTIKLRFKAKGIA